MSWTKISNRWCRRGAIFPDLKAAQAACLKLGSRACPGAYDLSLTLATSLTTIAALTLHCNSKPTGVYDELCDGRKPYLCKGSPFSTGIGGSCLHKSTAPLYRAFKPTTNMELKRAIQTCSRDSSGLVKSDGDTVGGAGYTLNPVKGNATHAVIWLHGLGDTCEGWSDAMKGFFPMTTNLCIKN